MAEQELYAGADSMEIVRDAHAYFSNKQMEWQSANDAIRDLDSVHRTGVEAMGLLVVGHLTGAGAAVRRKVEGATTTTGKRGAIAATSDGTKQRAMTAAERAEETASATRDRLTEALVNCDLMKSVGEYEEYIPLSTRVVRELRAIFECLGRMASDGQGLILSSSTSLSTSTLSIPDPAPSLPSGGKVLRTEKVDTGHYANYTTMELRTGYPHLYAYGEVAAYASVDGYCRQLRNAQKNLAAPAATGGVSPATHARNVDSAARDAVRCIEHTMVVVSGEKSVYQCVVAPSSLGKENSGDDAATTAAMKEAEMRYQKALVISYSYVISAALDRLLDLVEYTYLRECGCATTIGTPNTWCLSHSGIGYSFFCISGCCWTSNSRWC